MVWSWFKVRRIISGFFLREGPDRIGTPPIHSRAGAVFPSVHSPAPVAPVAPPGVAAFASPGPFGPWGVPWADPPELAAAPPGHASPTGNTAGGRCPASAPRPSPST